jgi:prophage antirepressor-like protein
MAAVIELTESTYVIKTASLRHHLDEKGEPWFIARDVCEYLEIANVSDACQRIFDGAKGIATADTPGGPQEMLTVSEPGLYQLIFQSRKPEAVEFQRWVFEDLLPNLRRHGFYRMPGRPMPGIGKRAYGRQPFLDEIKRRGLTQREAFDGLNAIELNDVPQVSFNVYTNSMYGQCRPSAALAVRASALLGVSVDQLLTAPVRD